MKLSLHALTLLIPAMGSFAAPSAHAQQAPVDGSAARPAILAMIDSAAASGFTGHVLAIRDGQPFVEASRGLADPVTGARIDSTTIFSIGSVTKRFTRAALIRLEEQGRLATSDPISRFLPGLPADKQGITIDQLLDMRAGFHEYHDTRGDTVPGDHQRLSKEDALQRIAAQRLRFEPGTERAYSNSGYTLLAMIVEAASGMPFEDYIRRTFLEPLGMSSTGFYGDTRWADARMARGTGMRAYGSANAPHRWPAVSWVLAGGGGMVSTARDLYTFIAAVRDGRVFGPAARAKFDARDPAVYAGGNDFGFGALVLEMDGSRDVVIAMSSAGPRRMHIAVPIAETMSGTQLPPQVRAMFAPQPAGTPAVAGDRQPQPLPDTPEVRTARAFIGALRDGSPAAITRAVETLFTPQMRAVAPMSAHLSMLGELGESIRSAQVLRLVPLEDGKFELQIGPAHSRTTVRMQVQRSAPHLLERVAIDGP